MTETSRTNTNCILQELGARTDNPKATLLGDTLMNATGKWLDGKLTAAKIKILLIKFYLNYGGGKILGKWSYHTD